MLLTFGFGFCICIYNFIVSTLPTFLLFKRLHALLTFFRSVCLYEMWYKRFNKLFEHNSLPGTSLTEGRLNNCCFLFCGFAFFAGTVTEFM